MRAVIQRVATASVRVAGATVGEIGPGLLALIGVAHGDGAATAERMAATIAHLRIFPDAAGRMNRSVTDVGGAVLVVSQFTLLADTSRGRRPSFTDAAPADLAEPLVTRVVDDLVRRGIPVASGRFGAHMEVSLVNDGPVTVLLEEPA